jgi:hypothetical protein
MRLQEFKSMMYNLLREQKHRNIRVEEVVLLRAQIKENMELSQLHNFLPKALRLKPKFLEFYEPEVHPRVHVPKMCHAYARNTLKEAFTFAKCEMFKRMWIVEKILYKLFTIDDPGDDQYLRDIVKVISYDFRVLKTANMADISGDMSVSHKKVAFIAGQTCLAMAPSQHIVLHAYVPFVLEFFKLDFETYLKPLMKSGFYQPTYTIKEYLGNEGFTEKDFSVDREWEVASSTYHKYHSLADSNT